MIVAGRGGGAVGTLVGTRVEGIVAGRGGGAGSTGGYERAPG